MNKTRNGPSKAANGSGSVKFYPSMNRIVGKCYHDGKPIKKYGRLGVGSKPGTEYNAEAAVVWNMLKPYLDAEPESDKMLTVRAMIDAFLKGKDMRDSTRERYMKVIYQKDGALQPWMQSLAPMRAIEVKPSDVTKAFGGVVSTRGAKMARTRQLLHRLLRAAFNFGPIRDGSMTKNPAAAKGIAPKYEREEKTRVFTPVEQGFIRQANVVLGGANEALLLLMLSMPVRPCEAYALRRRDLDLGGRRVRIENDLTETKASGYKPVLGPCKTKESVRTIFLYDEVAAALSRQLQAQMAAGRTTPESYLFSSPDGLPVRHNNVARRWFKPLLEKAAELAREAGYDARPFPDDAGMYSLRHTAIFNLKRAGVPLDVIKVLAGHKYLSTTLEIYNQLTDEDGAEAAQAVGEWFARKAGT